MISLKINFKKPKKSDERKSEENSPSNENSKQIQILLKNGN